LIFLPLLEHIKLPQELGMHFQKQKLHLSSYTLFPSLDKPAVERYCSDLVFGEESVGDGVEGILGN